MNTEMTDEQRIAPCRIHYEAWATSAGFPSLEVALATGRRTTHCGLPTVEGGFLFLFRSGILLAVLEAVVAGDVNALNLAKDSLPPDWQAKDGLNDGTYAPSPF
jgi:hypothetical protein